MTFWRKHYLSLTQISRDRDKGNFLKPFRRLYRLGLMSRQDVQKLHVRFAKTKHSRLFIRPGVGVDFFWDWTGKLPEAKAFAKEVKARLIEGVSACGQPFALLRH